MSGERQRFARAALLAFVVVLSTPVAGAVVAAPGANGPASDPPPVATADTETATDADRSTADNASGPTAYLHGRDGLVAVDPATGGEIWEVDDLDGGLSASTAAYGTVYVASEDSNLTDLHLYAIDAVTGDVDWQYTVQTDDFSSATAPTVVDGTVYVGLGESNSEDLYAVDAFTGEKRWSWIADDRGVAAAPTVADGTVYVRNVNSEYGEPSALRALDADTGDTEWVYSDGDVSTPPALFDDTLYVGTYADDEPAELHAVDADTGDTEWTFTLDEERGISSNPVVTDGTVYFGSGSYSGTDAYRLYAVSTVTGEKRWTWATEDRRIATTPTVADGTVYLKRDNSYLTNLYAFDSATGDRKWTANTGGGDWVTVYDDRVYVHSRTCVYCSPSLHAYDPATGDRYWSEGAYPTTPMTVVDDPEDGFSVDSAAILGVYGHTETLVHDDPDFALFEVTDVTPQDPVIAGDELEVDVTVENAGDEAGTDAVEFVVDDDVIDAAENVALAPGETWDGTFTYRTEPGDGPGVDVAIETTHDSETIGATVDPVPAFDVDVVDTNAPVEEDETLTVNASVGNTASIGEAQAVTLSVDGSLVDSAVVSLDAGEATTEPLTYTTQSGDAPTVDVTVASDHDEASATVSVRNTTTSPTANVGDVTRDGEFSVADVLAIHRHVIGLDPDPFDELLADVDRDGEVSFVDAVLLHRHLLGLEDPPAVEITALEAPEEVVAGDPLEVSTTVANDGGLGTIQRVEYRLIAHQSDPGESALEAVEVVDLAPGGAVETTKTIDSGNLSHDTYSLEVVTEDDTAITTVTVTSTDSDEVTETVATPGRIVPDATLTDGAGPTENVPGQPHVSLWSRIL